MNAANVKVLQVGQSSNVLNELNMTANQYNWVQSIYFVSIRSQRDKMAILIQANRSATSFSKCPAT